MKSYRTATAILFGLISLLAIVTSYGQTRPRPAAAQPSDIKIKYRSSMSSGRSPEQATESVTMIKGARERSEMRMGQGFDTITITQCDKKQTIQISETTKKYLITPMVVDTSTSPAPAANAPQPSTPARKGGTVTYITSSVDTGERREMFGFTARHVKSSMTIQSSPDACNPVNQRTETDGWYIDFNVAFDCNLDRRPPVMPNLMRPGGCVDQPVFRRTGNAKTGYPLIETMTMYGENNQPMFSTTKEVVELTREPLDIALFDVPAGYTQATTQQEMFAIPSATDMMAGRQQETTNASPASTAGAKQPGVLRVGVVQINNKAGKSISPEALRQRLIGQIQGAGIDAVPLNGMSTAEIEAEAKAKQCDYVLYSDLTALKTGKIGGLFGRVSGIDVGKTEAKVEFKLFAVGETSPRLQMSATAKVEGEEASAGTAIDSEAKAVIAEVRKR